MSAVANDMQGTEEWLAQRRGKATASRFKDVLAMVGRGEAASRRNYRADLVVERITGESEPFFESWEMKRGRDLEPEARAAYLKAFDLEADHIEAGFIDHDSLMAGCSPDGFIGMDGLVEIKCPERKAKHIALLLEPSVPSEYHWQVQGQLWITGRDWCDFVSYHPAFPPKMQLVRIRVKRDAGEIKKLEAAVRVFLHEVDEQTARVLALVK